MASNPNNLNMGMRCIKYMLIIINLMFVLTSVLLLIVGTTIQTIYGDFNIFLDDHFLSPPALLIAIGAFMLIVAAFGCIGAYKESTLLINIYGVFLLLIFILQLAAAISAFALQGQIREMLLRTMENALQLYPERPYIANGVDFMQNALQCCGIHNSTDWEGILTTSENTGNDNIALPNSCCAYIIGDECEYFTDGCFSRMNFIVSQSAMLIATGATTVAFVQILGIICAFMLAKTIRRTKSLRMARRWQLQQSLGIVGTEKPAYEDYTQLGKAEKGDPQPVTYTANSPSVN